MKIKVGITGTRRGATLAQKEKFLVVMNINVLRTNVSEFHHGLCVGLDCESHELVRKHFPHIKIIGHPPIKEELKGVCECDEYRQPKSHFARNRDIVNECDAMIVVPYESSWQSLGGTWYTHDYAVKVKKPMIIIWPDGSTTNQITGGVE